MVIVKSRGCFIWDEHPFYLTEIILMRIYFSILSLFCLLSFLTSCKRAVQLFESIPASQSNIHFINKPFEKDTFNILYYLYYYNGGGVATGDINNDGFVDIFFTGNNKGANKLYLNKGIAASDEGGFEFEDITEKAGVAGTSDWCTGVTMVDVNADGLLDIYVSAVNGIRGLQGKNELFINKGQGLFKESAAQYGLAVSSFATQAAFFDYDHDGDLDCYILNHSQKPHQNISDTSHRRTYDKDAGDRLLRNDIATTGQFTDVSAAAGIFQSGQGYGLGLATSDINNDGWDDIYVGNDFHENDYYYINNGNGTFTESGAKHFKHYSRFSMGNDVADYDNDGNPDVITVDMLPPDEKTSKTYGSDDNLDIYRLKIENNGYQQQYSRNCLQHNNGNAVNFSEVGIINNVYATDWSWAPLFADFDNDGVKDLFVSSGIVKRPVDLDYVRFISSLYMKHAADNTDIYDQEAIDKMPDGSSHPFFFKGNIKEGFKDVSADWGTGTMAGYYTGASYADLDNDGDLDMVMNCINSKAVILKNNSPVQNHLSVSFKGNDQNSFGIGCKVYLFQKGNLQYQQLMLTRGFQSSVSPALSFGMGKVSYIDSVLVIWPDQQYEIMHNVSHNNHLLMKQSSASGHFNFKTFFPPKASVLSDVSGQLKIPWKHIENDFLDFNKQYLIPHQLSTRGPKIAVSDVNKDGLDDFFVCGAKGQSGVLMIQTANGKFIASDTAVFGQFRNSEGVDALFFDANGDSYPDLYVVSGGNELEDGNAALADHLFLNNTKGHFIQSKLALPAILTNKSCVAVADIDKDGDNDLFVGGMSDATHYGIAQPSYLLLNNGEGGFRIADSSRIQLDKAGIITSASFADMNGDGWDDLIIAGEWTPVQVFLNRNAVFSKAGIAGSSGLWQSLLTADVNGDGLTDILAGNWGYNSKLYTGKNGPLKLFVKDFDKNGTLEQILTYAINGKDYTFLAKDELERSLPVLKKAYLTYSEVAGKTVDYMFYDLFRDYTLLKADMLGSACFLNDGKGGFITVPLPGELQTAPLMHFVSLQDGKGGFLAAGNFYGVIPFEGRYDALLPTGFFYDKTNRDFKTDFSLPGISGEIRDAKWMKVQDGKKILLIARNNDSLLFYQ